MIMKTRVMIVGFAVAGLLLAVGTANAQERVVRVDRPEREVVGTRNIPGGVSREPEMRVPERRGPERREPERMHFDDRGHRDLRPVTEAVVTVIVRAAFDADRLARTRDIIREGGMFYADQVYDIARTFRFNQDRIEFLEMAYDITVDRCNFYRAVETLTFRTDRERLMEALTERAYRTQDWIPRYAVAKGEYKAMLRTLDALDFDSDRELMIRFIAASGQLTMKQIAGLTDTMTFASNRRNLLDDLRRIYDRR